MKPSSLTNEEWQTMKKHTEIGDQIAKSSPQLVPIAPGILHHHEWWDGTGYPWGLKGQQIPLLARIISIVDAYDVMVHDRTYKKAASEDEAREELKRCAGSQFDPNLVDVFLRYKEREINEINEKNDIYTLL
jgi:HD-GYP domain-containing protein (c-di-GMP phosphodiesterase class II)